jgi:hypothetical protein
MRKKAGILITLQLLISMGLMAQPPQIIVPKWKVGDSMIIQEKGSIQMTLFGVKMPIESNTKYQLKVTSKDSEGYIIEAHNISFIDLTGGGPMEELIKELANNLQDVMKKAEQMKLVVRISPQGEVKDLLNWQQVQTMLQELGDGLLIGMGTKYNIPKEALDSIRQKNFAKIDTKEKVMQQTLEELEYLMSGYNVKYPLTGKLNVPSLIYSRMNYFELNHTGVPATLTTKTISRKATDTQVSYDVVYNKQALLDYINKTSERKSLYTKDVLDKMIITEDRSFDFNLTTNWPKKIKMNSRMTIEKYIDIVIVSEYTITQY